MIEFDQLIVQSEINGFESEGGVRATPAERKRTGRTMKEIGPDRDEACIVMIQLAALLQSVGVGLCRSSDGYVRLICRDLETPRRG